MLHLPRAAHGEVDLGSQVPGFGERLDLAGGRP